jgi:hypothetical protein
MGPGQEDREQAAVKAGRKAAGVGAGVAVMEPARAAPACVQIAARKPRTGRGLPALI